MTTAVIVVCLPGLKKLLKRLKLPMGSDREHKSQQSSSGLLSGSRVLKSRQTTQSHAPWGVKDDEIEPFPEGEEYLRMPDLVLLKSEVQQ
jgi:hypothetical protein